MTETFKIVGAGAVCVIFSLVFARLLNRRLDTDNPSTHFVWALIMFLIGGAASVAAGFFSGHRVSQSVDLGVMTACFVLSICSFTKGVGIRNDEDAREGLARLRDEPVHKLVTWEFLRPNGELIERIKLAESVGMPSRVPNGEWNLYRDRVLAATTVSRPAPQPARIAFR